MLCPVCNIDLMMSERNGVEIDYCPKCRGVWLDRGELDKIIERNKDFNFSSKQESKARDFTDYEHKNYYKKKKKESWLGELFDF
ncbi:zf-TFIIB domain-containing protein [Campylobacter sp. VicNov18]|uniref:TFIIB-type zinc ribbon-containing protein n=1 Tax=Campylobacter bilis TaxID=2691918 RepID=UPI00130E47BE|nr:zf-TFIIB domain-containing protein [Campylobacter bilis]MPV63202.1 hypothetical protein [Campylobacter hepaticus]MBM0636702.1 hypothetical protein [Campylobacter bilis]MCC8277546.1 zf-TFIIB domain-containing protein [Campylobacter bilis]MCC8298751.1 zf-TFIIB domain-containing protein [Campylobacter bilis]MCC8300455.1 zf-TFIIB domain-containing protein [Campylobacter bilis]